MGSGYVMIAKQIWPLYGDLFPSAGDNFLGEHGGSLAPRSKLGGHGSRNVEVTFLPLAP